MSDSIRSYSGTKGPTFGASPRRRRSGILPSLFLVLVLALIVSVFWVSRDAHDIGEFLPANQPLQVRVEQAINSRATLAASPVWSVLPADALAELRDALQAPLPVPEWLAKNLLNRELYWFGDSQTGEGVLVSRMTRVGTISARLALFMPSIERDWAGGLNLSTLPDRSLYFAVRGRILIASESRRAVVEALTLAEEERTSLAGYLLEAPENAHIAGVAVLAYEEAARFGVDRIEFGVVSESNRFGLVARGTLSDQSSTLSDMLAGARPVTLNTPADAPAALVVNLNTPLKELSIAMGEATGTNWPDAIQWDEWSTPPENDRDRPAVAELLAQLGPELHVTVHDVDPNEVLPVPEIVIRSPHPPTSLIDQMQRFPAPMDGPSIDTVRASYNPESGILRIPTAGGDSFEPSGAFHGEQFVFSTSLSRLNRTIATASNPSTLPGTNNVYLRIQPNSALETVAAAGRVLAEDGLLEGHTPESFERQVAEWHEQFKTIESVEAVVRTADGLVVLECEMRFTSP